MFKPGNDDGGGRAKSASSHWFDGGQLRLWGEVNRIDGSCSITFPHAHYTNEEETGRLLFFFMPPNCIVDIQNTIMKLLNLNHPNGFGLGLEEVTEPAFAEFAQTQTVLSRHMWRSAKFLMEKLGYVPYVFFKQDELDIPAIEKMLKHPELLKVVHDWIENNNKNQLPSLIEAKKVFEKIQQPPKHSDVLYRGFQTSSGQQTHGLDRQALHDMNVGDTFTDTPGRAVSFSSNKEVARSYGNIIVTVNYAEEQKRMFHITNEVLVAAFMNADGDTEVKDTLKDEKLFSYFESIFLPDEKPLEFMLHEKADNVNVANNNYQR